jgi:hypothetical protein
MLEIFSDFTLSSQDSGSRQQPRRTSGKALYPASWDFVRNLSHQMMQKTSPRSWSAPRLSTPAVHEQAPTPREHPVPAEGGSVVGE